MVKAGRHTFIPDDIKCFEGVELTFGNFTSIASGLTIVSGQHPPIIHPQVVSQYPFFEEWDVTYYPSKMKGQVTVGNDVWVGEGVTILEGVEIGDGAILGAKAVIGSNVPPYAIAIGNPWKVLRKRFNEDQIKQLLKIKWWDWDDEEIRDIMPLLGNIDLFLAKFGGR